MTRRILAGVFAVFCAGARATGLAQDRPGTFSTTHAFPQLTAAGILFTDSDVGTLYIVKDGEAAPLFSSPGAGRYVSLSADRTRAGLKLIGQTGEQARAVIEIGSGALRLLH